MRRKKTLLSTLAFFMYNAYSFAQTSVTGIVTDEQGNLPNAVITIEEDAVVITSKIDGSFSFQEIVDGDYTLTVEYGGYEKMTIPFQVINQQPINLGLIKLKEDQNIANELSEVVITSVYKASQARAMNMKKTSNTISEVLSADAIGKLPDRNAAEAVQRMQGVSIERDMGEGRFVAVRGTPIQWTASTLNGNRMPSASGDNAHRGIQMDIFPSELIQYVKLSKALTPDLDEDAIGGSIDFITKTSPNKEVLAVSAAGGYVDYSDSFTSNASVLYGNKITDKLKFITSAVIWNRSSALDQVRNIYNFNLPNEIESYSINQLQLRDYVADRRTLGFNLGLDYEFNSNNKIYFKGLFSQYLDKQTVRETYFNFDQKNVQLQARHADYITDLYNFQLGGTHRLNKKLNFEWSFTKARSSFQFDSPKNLSNDQRGYPIINFIQAMDYGNLSFDGRKYLKIDSPDNIGDNKDLILPHNNSPINADQLRLNQVILSQNKNSDRDYTGKFDFNYSVNPQLELKFGTKFLNKEKIVDSKTLVWMPMSGLGIPNTPITYMSQLEREKFPHNGGFMQAIGSPYNNQLIDQITNGQIDLLYNTNVQDAMKLLQVVGANSDSNIASSYRGEETVWATYAMATWKLSDHIQIVGGLRNEYNKINFYGKKVNSSNGNQEVEDIKGNKEYNVLLPMFNLKFNLTKDQILRAAYTRSFSRPDFNDLNPGTIINDINYTITQGNTDLNPTYSNNFDIMYENYFGKMDLFTAGVFYKSITDIIYKDQTIVPLNGQNYSYIMPKNLEGANLFGVEIGIVKRFDNLPGILKNFGFEGNYTFIDSKMDMPIYENGQKIGTMETSIPNQAKHIFNTILFYENKNLMVRLAGNYKGDYVSEIRSAAGPNHYLHFDKNFTIDASASYKISKRFRVFAEINNILNEPNRYYHGNKNRLENLSYSGVRGQIGLNFNL